jgi:hypothetical protein
MAERPDTDVLFKALADPSWRKLMGLLMRTTAAPSTSCANTWI